MCVSGTKLKKKKVYKEKHHVRDLGGSTDPLKLFAKLYRYIFTFQEARPNIPQESQRALTLAPQA